MATISSHVLDSLNGTHAAGIRVQCFERDSNGSNALVFDVKANEQGRISETVQLQQTGSAGEIDLVFHAQAYFDNASSLDAATQTMRVVVVRLSVPDSDCNYHVPIMLASHSYSVWWNAQIPVDA